jgi:LmbE family N-acetylglucosaminyl deacetylase
VPVSEVLWTGVSTARAQDISGAGTAEAEWAAWEPLSTAPTVDLGACRRAVVVAPHPDDETLGVGGTIAALLGAGAEVTVVTASDGEASHPDSRTVTPSELGRRRPAEAEAAMAVLAAGRPGSVRSVRLHLPDGRLARTEATLTAQLASRLHPGEWCLATWDGDGHPDHQAVGRAATAACRATGARLLSYLIWTWHWAMPGDARVPWDRLRRLPLTDDLRRRKELAVACFPSQIHPLGPGRADGPVVPPGDLAHFGRPYETVVT